MSENTPIQGVPLPMPIGMTAGMQQQDFSGSIDVRRLRMPVTMTIAILAVAAGAILSVALAWASITSHANNRAIHADETESLKSGGVAYHANIDQLRAEFKKSVHTEGRQTRLLISTMAINCAKKGGEFNCTVQLRDPALAPDNE